MASHTLQSLATEAYKCLEIAQRTCNGEDFVRTKDDTPEWVVELIHDAHGTMGPDDWRYQWIREALDAYGSDDPEDVNPEADIYTSYLCKWLSSRNDRTGWVDEAVEENGHSIQGIIGDLQMGQEAEKREVYDSVLSSLRDRLETLEEDEEATEEQEDEETTDDDE